MVFRLCDCHRRIVKDEHTGGGELAVGGSARGEQIFFFGFIFMVWQHFYKEFLR